MYSNEMRVGIYRVQVRGRCRCKAGADAGAGQGAGAGAGQGTSDVLAVRGAPPPHHPLPFPLTIFSIGMQTYYGHMQAFKSASIESIHAKCGHMTLSIISNHI